MADTKISLLPANAGNVALADLIPIVHDLTGTPVTQKATVQQVQDAMTGKISTSRAINTTSPLAGGGDLSADRTLSIADAAADGSTKGAAAFTSADFNSAAGVISLDYTNGQAASAGAKGFLTAADWSTFNGKQAALGFTPINKAGDTGMSGTFNFGVGNKIQLLSGDGSANFATGKFSIDATGGFFAANSEFIVDGATGNTFIGSLITFTAASGSTVWAFPSGSVIFADSGLSAGSKKISNVTDPAAAQDAATKAYVDAQVSGVGTAPFVDTTAIVKGSVDATKLLRFEVDGFTTATTRIATPPNQDFTIAGLEVTQTFTKQQTITPAVNTSALVASGFSLTGSNAQALLDLSGTWNTSGTPTGLNLSITDTTSNGASLLANFLVGGSSKFSVNKAGNVSAAGSITATGDLDVSSGTFTVNSGVVSARELVFTNTALAGLTVNNLTEAERDALTPAPGNIIFNTDTDKDEFYNGTRWEKLNETSILIPLGDETTVITTGTAKKTFRMPFAMVITQVKASLTTASSSGLPTFDINEAGSTILSTKITIDTTETTSLTAAAPPVVSDSALAADAIITIDIDVAGTNAAGAKVCITGYKV